VTEPDSSDSEGSESEHEYSFHFPGLQCCGGGNHVISVDDIESSDEEDEDEEEDEEVPIPARQLEERTLSRNFRQEVDHLPPLAAPTSKPQQLLVDELHLEDLSLDQVERALFEDSLIEEYLSGYSKSYDISLSYWSTTPGGDIVRRAEFTMPVPQDVPPAIARLAAVPKTSRATLLYSFKRAGDDELLMQLQQCTHDVPQGECFRVQECLRFRSHPPGGLTYSKWTTVSWVKPLPWLFTPMKSITESRTAAGAKDASVVFVEAMTKAARKLTA